ncbi:MAG: S41 family peptidase [Candidatus Cryptobacteroides sp.]
MAPRHIITVLVALVLCSCEVLPTCVEADMDIARNFDCFCNILEEEYSFSNIGVGEWPRLKSVFRERALAARNDSFLFELLKELSDSLKDGHLALGSQYGAYQCMTWREGRREDFQDSLIRYVLPQPQYIGKTTLFGLIPDTDIAYFRYPSFSKIFTEDNYRRLDAVFSRAGGIIIDIRSNYGGNALLAEEMASHFYSEKTLIGYNTFGASIEAETKTFPCEISPSDRYRWADIPVVILIDGCTFSAANYFVLCMKQNPCVVTMGCHTGGGAGFPVTRELPNGWLFSFPKGDTLDMSRNSIDSGIAPDYDVHLDPSIAAQSRDNIIETACKYLEKVYLNRSAGSVLRKSSALIPPSPITSARYGL